jgi:hypothetical protein
VNIVHIKCVSSCHGGFSAADGLQSSVGAGVLLLEHAERTAVRMHVSRCGRSFEA